jgi:hypothetical protein
MIIFGMVFMDKLSFWPVVAPENLKGAHLMLLPEGTDQGAPSEKHKAAPIRTRVLASFTCLPLKFGRFFWSFE